MKNWRWYLLSALVVVLDQLSKIWAAGCLLAYQPKALMPFVNLTLAYNSGAAFSFLSNAGGWQRWILSGFSLIMSLVLLAWIARTEARARWQKLGLSLILGGAVGNLIDRLFYGRVVDFIDLYYKNHHWPAVFNIADVAITVGVVILFVDLFFDDLS